MRIIKPYTEIINKENIDGIEILKNIEMVGRTCYKSEVNITEDSCKKFTAMLISRGHEAMIEHNHISVKFVCDRGVSHELVRHRLASFGQESTRYCNYTADKFNNELTFIEPIFLDIDPLCKQIWIESMKNTEENYLWLVGHGWSPQDARSILPNSLKTEIVMTMNIREWRHFFMLRADTPAHPQMRELVIPLLHELNELVPIVFEDIFDKINLEVK